MASEWPAQERAFELTGGFVFALPLSPFPNFQLSLPAFCLRLSSSPLSPSSPPPSPSLHSEIYAAQEALISTASSISSLLSLSSLSLSSSTSPSLPPPPPPPPPSKADLYLHSLHSILTSSVTKSTSSNLIKHLKQSGLKQSGSPNPLLPPSLTYDAFGLLGLTYLQTDPAKAAKCASKSPSSLPSSIVLSLAASHAPPAVLDSWLSATVDDADLLYLRALGAVQSGDDTRGSALVAKSIRAEKAEKAGGAKSASSSHLTSSHLISLFVAIPPPAGKWSLLASCYERMKMFEPAWKTYCTVCSLGPAPTALWLKRASAALRVCGWEDAKLCLEAASSPSPDEATMIAYIRGVVALQEYQEHCNVGAAGFASSLIKACLASTSATLLASDQFAAVKTVADLLYHDGDMDGARAAYQKCADLTIAAIPADKTDLSYSLLQARLADTYNDIAATTLFSDPALAVQSFFSALQAAPSNFRSFTGLALAFQEQNNYELSVAAVSHGIDREWREANAEAWGVLARLYVRGMAEGEDVDVRLVEKTLESLSHVCDAPLNWVLRGLAFLHAGSVVNAHQSFETSFAGKYEPAGLAGYVTTCSTLARTMAAEQRATGGDEAGVQAVVEMAKEAEMYWRIHKASGGENKPNNPNNSNKTTGSGGEKEDRQGWEELALPAVKDEIADLLSECKVSCGEGDVEEGAILVKEARKMMEDKLFNLKGEGGGGGGGGGRKVTAAMYSEAIALGAWCDVCVFVENQGDWAGEEGASLLKAVRLEVLRAKRWDMGNAFVKECAKMVAAIAVQ